MEASRMGEDLPSLSLFHNSTSHIDHHPTHAPCFSTGSSGDNTATTRTTSRHKSRQRQRRRPTQMRRTAAFIQGPLVKRLWQQQTMTSSKGSKYTMLEDSESEDEEGYYNNRINHPPLRSLRMMRYNAKNQSLPPPVPFPNSVADASSSKVRSNRSSSWRTRIPKRLKTSSTTTVSNHTNKERFVLSIPSPHKPYDNRNHNNNMTPNTIDTKDTFGYNMDHDDDDDDYQEDEDEHDFCLEMDSLGPHSRQDTPSSSSPLVLQYIRNAPRGSSRHANHSTTEAEQLYFRGMQKALAQERTKVADLISLSTQTILRRGNRSKNTLPLHMIRWHDRLVLGAVLSCVASLAILYDQPLVVVASLWTIGLASYLASQIRRTQKEPELRANQDRIRKEIEYLETANTHLKARAVAIQTSQKREWNICSSAMQGYLTQATTCSATNAQDVVALVQERKRTLEVLHERLVQEIGMVFLRTVLKTSRRGDDGLTMNALGLELAVKRLSSLPHVTLYPKHFRALCVREKYSILWIYRHLIDDVDDANVDDTTRVVPDQNKKRIFSLSLTYSCTTTTRAI